MNEQELSILIRAQNVTQAAFTQARKDLASLGIETRGLNSSLAPTGGLFGGITSQLKATALGFISAQAAIGVVTTAYHSLTAFIGSSIDAYAAQESAVKRMTTALQSQGTATPLVIGQFEKMAAGFQNTTVYADELINEMQALLVQVGNVMPSQMQGALKASTDLASGLGIDLRTATLLVGKAFEGETGTLKRYGIVIDEAKLKTQGVTAVLNAIQDKFGGQAVAEVDTYAGHVKQLANAWDEVKEAVGRNIVQNPVFVAALRIATEETKKHNEAGATDRDELARRLGPTGLLGKAYLYLADSAKAANIEVSNLTRALANAPKMPQFGGPTRSNQFGQDPINVKEYLDAEAAAQKDAADAAKRHADAIARLRDELTGKGTLKAAQDMISALRGGVPIHEMMADKIALVNKTMGDALDVYKATGREAPAAIHKAYLETIRLTDTIPRINRFKYELEHSADGLIPMIGVLDRAWPTTISGLERVVPIMGEVINKTGTFGTTFHDSFLKTFSSLPDTLSRAFEGGGGLSGAFRSIAVQVGQDFGKSMSAAIVDQLNKQSAGYTGSAMSGKTIGLSVAGGALAGFGAASSGASTGQQIGMVGTAAANAGVMSAAAGAGTAGSIAFAAYTAGAGLAVIAAYKIIKAMNDGRKVMQDYYKTFAGGSDELRKQMLVLGDEGERLWIKLTQQTGKGDKKGAQSVIAEINAALATSPAALANAAGFQTIADLQTLADQARKTYDYMRESGLYSASSVAQAWQASKDAQIAALGDTAKAQLDEIEAIKTQYADAIGKLKGELESFSSSLQAEADAPEYDEMGNRIYGVVETQQMARAAQIKQEMAALQEQSDAEVAAKQETFDAWVAAGKTADEQIREIFGKVMEIPVRFMYPEGVASPGAPSTPGYAHGTHGEYVDFGAAGTMVRLHNRERVMTEREGAGGQPIVINLRSVTQIDGREVALTTARHLHRVLAPYGVR